MAKSTKTAVSLVARFGVFDCAECHHPRINVMAGSVCGFGCDGKILPPVPAEVHRVAEAMLRGDIVKADWINAAEKAAGTAPPDAPDRISYKTREFWIFEGKLWRRVRLSKQDARPKTDRMVLQGTKLVQITPWSEANRVLLRSMSEAAHAGAGS